MRNFTIASEAGMFCGWPANNGLARCWDNELTVPFVMLPFVDRGDGHHAVSRLSNQELCIARSLDGGATWAIEKTGVIWPYKSHHISAVAIDEPLPFADLNLSVMISYESANRGNSAVRVSDDRGRTWSVPYAIPEFARGVCGRTDYVEGETDNIDAAVFLFTVPSANLGKYGRQKEGRVIAAETKDGGMTWEQLAEVGRDPIGGFSIMPSTVLLADRMITALRVLDDSGASIEIWRTDTEEWTWELSSTPCRWPKSGFGATSSPASLVALGDGTLVLTYNDRIERRACARLSKDDGETWGEEIVLQADAGNWDIGYIRSVVLPTGDVLSAYYWNDYPDRERYIAGTIWRP